MNSRFYILILAIGLSFARAEVLPQPDLVITMIRSPVYGDTYPLAGGIVPSMRVENFGTEPDSLWAFSRIEHTCSTYAWRDSVWTSFPVMAEVPVSFDTWFPRYPGLYRFQFSLGLTDTTPWYYFWVSGSAGIEEPSPPVRHDYRLAPIPSFVRGVLDMPSAADRESQVVLLDATGRKVLDLQPGPNDISRLAPGVYFIRSTSPNHYWGRKLVLMK